MNVKNLGYLISMIYLICEFDLERAGDISRIYSGAITKSKIKNNFKFSKTFYQSPQVKKQRFYHNKTIPLGCRKSCESLYGKELKDKIKMIKNKKSLESKV